MVFSYMLLSAVMHSRLYIIKKLKALMNSGVDIWEAVELCAAGASTTKEKQALISTADRIKAGSTPTEAFSGNVDVFGHALVESVRVGETASDITAALNNLSKEAEIEARSKSTVHSNLMYPALIAMLGAAIVVLFYSFIVPQFEAISSEVGYINKGHQFWKWFAVIFSGLVFILTLCYLIYFGRIEKNASRAIWWYSWLRPFREARKSLLMMEFGGRLGILLKGGVSLKNALMAIQSDSTDPQVHELAARALGDLNRGESTEDVFGFHPAFPNDAMWTMAEASRKGMLPEVLETITNDQADKINMLLPKMRYYAMTVSAITAGLIILITIQVLYKGFGGLVGWLI